MADESAPRNRLTRARLLLWVLVVLALLSAAMLVLFRDGPRQQPHAAANSARGSFGGPFTLIGADGKPYSSQALAGEPYAIYFGFTRCGDVCPMTLSRLVRLRRAGANDQAMHIVFVTIDPANDGPKEVGQYAELFGAPIIGLTGSQAQIDAVKKQYGIYAEPVPHAAMGKQMEHTATVLLFDRDGKYATTIVPDEPYGAAHEKLKALTA
jgi:protein SCO1/2